nr:uncharacterized mitochondrial protein AtMg00810-like [Tanacetum cinerariifolium]
MQYDDLRVEFNTSEFNLVTYKGGLAFVEEQFFFYIKNEIDLSYSGLEEFQQPKFQSYRPKSCKTESKNASKEIPNELKESLDAPFVKNRVSNNKDCTVESSVVVEKKTIVPTVTKIEFVKAKQQEKPVRKPVKYAEMYRLTAITIKGKGWYLGIFIQRPRPVNTVRPRPVNTARRNLVVVNAVRTNKNPTIDKPQSSCAAKNKNDNGVNKDSGIDAHEKSANNINDVNTVGPSINTASTDFDTGSLNINNVSLTVSTASPEATHANFFGFEDPDHPNKVYKVVKALYGLHYAPRAWNETLTKYLLGNRPDIMYVVCVCAKFQVTPKVSHLHAVKRTFRYLKGHSKFGLWYPKDSPFELVAYTDSDYARASLDRKSTTRGYQFLRRRLISWQCKK